MKRNKQEERKKEILALKVADSKIFDAIRRQGWIELDEPYQRGWEAEFILREDIARNRYAPELQEALDMCGKTVWCRRKDFKELTHKFKGLVDVKPYLRDITVTEYWSLSPSARKYFSERESSMWTWRPYKCIIELWKLEIKTYKHFVTHYREHDEILYQEHAEIEAKLNHKYYGEVYPNYSMRYWRKYQHKQEKGDTKRKLRNTIKAYNSGLSEFEDYIYPDGKLMCASYYW